MSQAMYSAQTGMSAAQTKVNVVADNIANMNTVGFKGSRTEFSDIFYNTLSSGSAPGTNLGGINGRQIGTGVRVAGITRNFTGGSAVTTGVSTNLAIKGNGFFTVGSATGEVLYTRAGNFTIDAEGHLVLPNGYKALGTDNALSANASNIPVKIPPLIQTETKPTDAGKLGAKGLNDLNGNVEVTDGNIEIVLDGAVSDVAISANDTVAQVVGKINNAFNAAGCAAQAAISADGTVVINKNGAPENIELNDAGSNFVSQTGLKKKADGSFETNTLNYEQTVRTGTNTTTAQKATSIDIYENGMVEVTYANGDKLSVMEDPNNPSGIVFKYQTGNPAVTISGADLDIPEGVAIPANFQLQMVNVVNPNGLLAVGSNAFKEGPNMGLATYGAISAGAFGVVNSGEYEGSNVDLAEQFTDMVISQRMMEANSRVFNAASEIMKSLAYLGQ